MHSPQTGAPFASALLWPPEVLNFAIAELRREFSQVAPERIVRAIDFAARELRPDHGRVRLLQRAREVLRESR